MQTIKIEIFDEDVEEYPIDELANEISESYLYDDYPAAHVRVMNEQTGDVYEVNPHKN